MLLVKQTHTFHFFSKLRYSSKETCAAADFPASKGPIGPYKGLHLERRVRPSEAHTHSKQLNTQTKGITLKSLVGFDPKIPVIERLRTTP